MATDLHFEDDGPSGLENLLDAIERRIAPLDSCFSSQTRALEKRFNATLIDMTALWVQTPMSWVCPANPICYPPKSIFCTVALIYGRQCICDVEHRLF